MYHNSAGYRRPRRYSREVPLIEQPFDWALKLFEQAMYRLIGRVGDLVAHQYKLLYKSVYATVCKVVK
jgi:hypothetical protein